ncbi:MAG TPA: class I SAM-dependent methyltransferase [Methanocella sp.]|nr:class I SAM-dependent methyltransferase [Methanocella sp.]
MERVMQPKDSDKIWDGDVVSDKQYFSHKFNANMEKLEAIIGNDKQWIIDIGCGSGLPMLTFARKGYKVSLFDYSKKSIEIAKEHFTKAGIKPEEVFCQDILKNTLESDRYDVAVSYGVIEHFYDDGKKFFIQEMYRVVKPGGIVVISQPNKACIPFTIMQKITKLIGRWKVGFENDNNAEEVYRFLKELGFEDKQFKIMAYNMINGYFYVPILRNILQALGKDTLENHMREGKRGYCLLYTIRKPK